MLYLAVEDTAHTDEDEERADERDLRAVSEHGAERVLPSLDELQADLDAWLVEYNERRPHQGRWCFAKTLLQTFVDSVPLAKETLLVA